MRGARSACSPRPTWSAIDWWCVAILYARDFPEVAKAITAHAPEAMGMSYELADARVEDMRADVWKLTRVTFTGAAILLREKAAYGPLAFAWRAEKRSYQPSAFSLSLGLLTAEG